VRVASDLNKRLDDQDNFPEWVSEKVGAIKSMMTGVMQYLASEQEADHAELGEFGAGVIAGGGVGEGVDAGKLHPMQKTINFAKKNGYEVKISPKGTRVSFYNPRYDHSVKTSIYKDGGELWVNFHDEDSGMSGNDPIGDFYGTFANAVERNGMYADDSEEDDDMHEGAKVDRMVRHIKSSEKKSGKSDKAAENIAWATLNKRGMLDNANKKKGK
jgi:hypothetical protein